MTENGIFLEGKLHKLSNVLHFRPKPHALDQP